MIALTTRQLDLYSYYTETIVTYFVKNLNNHKTQNIGAGISFIDAASVKRDKKQHYSFKNSEKIATANKIFKKTRVERDASNGSCIS